MKVVLVRSSSVYEDSRASKEIFAFLEAGYEVCVLGWDRDGKALKECKAAFKKYINKISFHFFKEKVSVKHLTLNNNCYFCKQNGAFVVLSI